MCTLCCVCILVRPNGRLFHEIKRLIACIIVYHFKWDTWVGVDSGLAGGIGLMGLGLSCVNDYD